MRSGMGLPGGFWDYVIDDTQELQFITITFRQSVRLRRPALTTFQCSIRPRHAAFFK
jgi:hypothetical protein